MADVQQSLRARLLNGARAYGLMLMSGSHIVTELLAGLGYDCLIVDHEHSPVDVSTGVGMLQAIAAGDRLCTPIVRVPAPDDPVYLKKVLDTLKPPAGLLVPMVETREQAEMVVSACRYPPNGTRGCAHKYVRASHWGMDENYTTAAVQDILICVQVESAAAVDRISEIAVDGVDAIFLGPFDLSCSVGKMGQFSDPVVQALLTRAEEAVLASGKLLTGFRSPDRDLADMYTAGYSLVCGGVELGVLRQAALADVACATEAMKETCRKEAAL
mmetsp:Transcript_73279/g.136950  ORF Transcript_73279/g.136950 Transcript_73279/m.136950 type:complete len:272 (+) Transcript_73279:57-872(+)